MLFLLPPLLLIGAKLSEMQIIMHVAKCKQLKYLLKHRELSMGKGINISKKVQTHKGYKYIKKGTSISKKAETPSTWLLRLTHTTSIPPKKCRSDHRDVPPLPSPRPLFLSPPPEDSSISTANICRSTCDETKCEGCSARWFGGLEANLTG